MMKKNETIGLVRPRENDELRRTVERREKREERRATERVVHDAWSQHRFPS